MVPTPIRLNDSVIRVFITCCDDQGIGRPGYVDVLANDPTHVIAVADEPLLDIGAPGTFDENGVLLCSIVDLGGDNWYMYYVGFELGQKIRYRLLTGLAISHDRGQTFLRASRTPILERSDSELYFRGGPYCVKEHDRYRLWYVAGSQWLDVDGKSMPVYDIRYAESADGIHWPAQGTVQISITEPDEHGFGRPCVIPKPSGGYRMFYSVRRKSYRAYRLGYAESPDGYVWQRMDDRLNLDVTPDSFDSDAIMYAAPIQIDDRLYVFYNGNDFGRNGFAVAVLEEE
ncbi:glycosylase [Hydrogenophilus hirschii]